MHQDFLLYSVLNFISVFIFIFALFLFGGVCVFSFNPNREKKKRYEVKVHVYEALVYRNIEKGIINREIICTHFLSGGL